MGPFENICDAIAQTWYANASVYCHASQVAIACTSTGRLDAIRVLYVDRSASHLHSQRKANHSLSYNLKNTILQKTIVHNFLTTVLLLPSS